MDISNNGIADVIQKSEKQNPNHFRQRDKQQRPYSDLREVLNQKRQAKDESKFNGPPSEPKYNFLSDPLRDSNEKPEHYGSGRLPPPRNNFEYRGRGRGRARSRGYYQSNNNYRPNYKRSDEGKGDLDIDNQEVADEHKSEDKNKDEYVGKEHSRYKSNLQFRPFQHRPNYQRRRYDPGAKHENSVQQTDQPEGSEKLQRQEDSTRGNYKPRKNFPGRGNQYYRPPHRYSPRYRGHQHKRNPKPLDPVNISVEYSVDTGTRKCTIENKEKEFSSSKEEHLKEDQKCVEVECEENWDEDAYYDETLNANEVDEKEIQHDIDENEEETNILEENKSAAKGNSEAEEEIIEKAEKEQENVLEENQDIKNTEEEKGNCIEEKQEIMKTEESEKYVEDKQEINSKEEKTVSVIEQKETLRKTEEKEKKEIKIEEGK